MIRHVIGIVAVAALAGAASAQLTETFPDPLGQWTNNWLYQNSNLGNYYVAAGDCNEDNRGNNPEGLWLVDTQACGAGTGGPADIYFNPAFAALITEISFGLEAFAAGDVHIYDKDLNLINTTFVSGGGFDFDHSTIVSATSNNGIGRIFFSMGGAEGNTSIDNVSVTLIPTPGAAAVLGAAGMAGLRRRRA